MDSFHKIFCKSILAGSSPVYNTSARRKRHECDTNNTSTTKCDTSATLATRVRHEYKHIFTPLYPYIYYMASERLQEEKQLQSKNYLLEMPRFHAKMRLKSAQQKPNFLINF